MLADKVDVESWMAVVKEEEVGRTRPPCPEEGEYGYGRVPEALDAFVQTPRPLGQDWFRAWTGAIGAREIPIEELETLAKDIAPQLAARTQTLASKWQQSIRLDVLEREILLLKERVADLEAGMPLLVPIQTFGPEPYDLLKPLDALVQKQGEYVASFLDADIHASGETEAEALDSLKSLILDAYDALITQDDADLGPLLIRQRAVLLEFIRKRQQNA